MLVHEQVGLLESSGMVRFHSGHHAARCLHAATPMHHVAPCASHNPAAPSPSGLRSRPVRAGMPAQAGGWMADAAKARSWAPSITLASTEAHASRQAGKRMFHHLAPFRAAATPVARCRRMPSPHTDRALLSARAEAAGMPCGSAAMLGMAGSLHALAWCPHRVVASRTPALARLRTMSMIAAFKFFAALSSCLCLACVFLHLWSILPLHQPCSPASSAAPCAASWPSWWSLDM